MNTAWKKFLSEQGARFTDDEVVEFNPTDGGNAEDDGLLIPLTHLQLISAHGREATSFLHAQLTSDVVALSAHKSQLGAYCTAKGRIVSIMRLIPVPEGMGIALPRTLARPVRDRLQRYILRADVQLNIIEDHICLGIVGPAPEEALQHLWGDVPRELDSVVQHNTAAIVRLAGSQPRYLCFLPVTEAIAHWQTLASVCHPVAPSQWRLLDIRVGHPQVWPETSEQFVPQMMNLDLLGGVSFSKGCYPGQEIVARLHYRGKLKQRMYRALTEADHLPEPGASIYLSTETGAPVGTVVDAQRNEAGRIELLVVIQITAAHQAALVIGNSAGPKLKLLTLPYDLPSETEANDTEVRPSGSNR